MRKFHTADPQNSSRQSEDMQQVPYCGTINIRSHRTQFSPSGDLVFGLCAPHTNLSTTNKNIFRRNSSRTVRLMKEDVMGKNGSQRSSKHAALPHGFLPINMYYNYGYHDLCRGSGGAKVRVLGELLGPKGKDTNILQIVNLFLTRKDRARPALPNNCFYCYVCSVLCIVCE
jgi:hypothetical protein